eukprot:6305301-Lingulodinium_polyedra.AAC.1
MECRRQPMHIHQPSRELWLTTNPGWKNTVLQHAGASLYFLPGPNCLSNAMSSATVWKASGGQN